MEHIKHLLLVAALCIAGVSYSMSGGSGSAKVMSYNVRIEVSGDTADMSWCSRREGVARMIRMHAPDIVGLQEPTIAQKEYLFGKLPEYGSYCISINDTLPESRTGNTALLYRLDRYQAVDSGYFWLSATPEVPSLPWNASDPYYRVGLWLRLIDKSTGRDIYALTTHFPYMDKPVDTEVRARCAQLIVDRLADMAGDDATIFVTGDMNCAISPDNAEAAGSRALAPFDKWMMSARHTAELTDNISSFNGFGTVPCDSPAGAIDHIFYRNARPLVFETLTAADFGLRWNSDHYPVLATFVY